MRKYLFLILFTLLPLVSTADHGYSAAMEGKQMFIVGLVWLIISIVGAMGFSMKRISSKKSNYFYPAIFSFLSIDFILFKILSLVLIHGKKPMISNSGFWFTIVLLLFVFVVMIVFIVKHQRLKKTEHS